MFHHVLMPLCRAQDTENIVTLTPEQGLDRLKQEAVWMLITPITEGSLWHHGWLFSSSPIHLHSIGWFSDIYGNSSDKIVAYFINPQRGHLFASADAHTNECTICDMHYSQAFYKDFNCIGVWNIFFPKLLKEPLFTEASSEINCCLIVCDIVFFLSKISITMSLASGMATDIIVIDVLCSYWKSSPKFPPFQAIYLQLMRYLRYIF